MIQREDLPLGTPEQKAQHAKAQATWEAKAGKVRAEMAALEQAKLVDVRRTRDQEVLAGDAGCSAESEERAHPVRAADRAARRSADLRRDRQSAAEAVGQGQGPIRALEEELGGSESIRPKPLPKAFVATDVGPIAPPTHVPGETDHPLEPGAPVVLDHLSLKLPAPQPSATRPVGRTRWQSGWVHRQPLSTRVITTASGSGISVRPGARAATSSGWANRPRIRSCSIG